MKRSAALNFSSVADGLGILGAMVCALHCIALPLGLVVGSTVLTVFMEDDAFHRTILWLVVPSAVLAFGLGCRRHKEMRVVLLGVLGLAGIVLSSLVLHDWIGEIGERIVTLGSAAVLITAHLRNFKLCRSNSCEHDEA